MRSVHSAIPGATGVSAQLMVREGTEDKPTPYATGGPRLLDRVRGAVRARHYGRRTERAYIAWIRKFVLFHAKRHPMELGEPEITAFLTDLAVNA